MRAVAGLAAAAALAWLVGWLAWTPERRPTAVQDTNPPSEAQGISAQPASQPERVTAQVALATLDPRADPAWDESPEGQRESREWCGQAHRRLRERQDGKVPPPDLHDLHNGDPVLANARRRVLERWARAFEHREATDDAVVAGLLRQMRAGMDRDLRMPPRPDEAQVWRRLLVLAGERRDAVAWILPHCPFEQCVEAAHWLVQVDPGNVYAWLAADRQLPAAKLLEGLSRAQEARPYEAALLGRLIGFATNAPGLRDAAEVETFESLGDWDTRWVFDLLTATCSETVPSAPLSESCLKAAERLWTLGGKATSLRRMALAMAEQFKNRDEIWRVRADWSSPQSDVLWQERMRLNFAVMSCDASERAGATLRSRRTTGAGWFE